MRIILAAPRGFCAGVNMAIESLELAIRLHGTPMYVYHEIVHNRWVVEHFRTRAWSSSTIWRRCPKGRALLFSAHGVSPRDPRAVEAPQAADHRRHLPAGDQGPSRGDPLCRRGLHDPAHRPRRARRSGRHDGRGARGVPPGARHRRRGDDRGRGPRASWPISRRRRSRSTRPSRSSPSSRSGSRTSSGRRRKTSATPRRTARRPCGPWPAGRRAAGRRQPQQLQQPPAGRAGLVAEHAFAPDRRPGRHRPEIGFAATKRC